MDPATGAIGAAGLTALAGLFSGIMQKESAEKAAREAEKAAREREARERLAQAQRDQISNIQQSAGNEQGALNQLMAVLARTAR